MSAQPGTLTFIPMIPPITWGGMKQIVETVRASMILLRRLLYSARVVSVFYENSYKAMSMLVTAISILCCISQKRLCINLILLRHAYVNIFGIFSRSEIALILSLSSVLSPFAISFAINALYVNSPLSVTFISLVKFSKVSDSFANPYTTGSKLLIVSLKRPKNTSLHSKPSQFFYFLLFLFINVFVRKQSRSATSSSCSVDLISSILSFSFLETFNFDPN